MAKYTGYVESAEDFVGGGIRRKKGGGYRILEGGRIEEYQPGGRPKEEELSPRSRYDTNITQIPQTGKYTIGASGEMVPENIGQQLISEGRAFEIPGFAERPAKDDVDASLEQSYKLTLDTIRNEYFEQEKSLMQLPPNSPQYQFMEARLQAEMQQKFSKADLDYQKTLQKFEDLDRDNTIDSRQTRMAKKLLLNKTFKFEMPKESLPKQVTDLELSDEYLKLSNALNKLDEASQSTLAANQLKARQKEIEAELARRKGYVWVDIPKQGVFSKPLQAWMPPDKAVEEYIKRGLPVPEELKQYMSGYKQPSTYSGGMAGLGTMGSGVQSTVSQSPDREAKLRRLMELRAKAGR